MRNVMLVAAIGLASAAHAQSVNYSGGTYSQNFDGLGASGSTVLTGRGPFSLTGILGSTGVDGWYGGNAFGSSANSEFRAQDGSLGGNTGRGVVFYGVTGNTERALGVLSTSNQISRFGALFVNNTGDVLTAVTISFTGEQWRRGNVTSPDSLLFSYGLTNSIANAATRYTALDFTSPNTQASPTEVALNGNDPLNQTAISATITGLNWASGATLAIAWDITELTGQDDGLAIDNFSLSAIPTPGATALAALALAAAGRRRR